MEEEEEEEGCQWRLVVGQTTNGRAFRRGLGIQTLWELGK